MNTVPQTFLVPSHGKSALQNINKKYLGTAVSQILFGILLIISSSIDLAFYCIYAVPAYVGSGIWSGCFLIIAGGIGLGLRCNFRKQLHDAYFGLSIFAALTCIGPIVCGIVGLSFLGGYNYYYSYCGYSTWATQLSMQAFLLCFGLAGGIASMVMSVYYCTYGNDVARIPSVGAGQLNHAFLPGQGQTNRLANGQLFIMTPQGLMVVPGAAVQNFAPQQHFQHQMHAASLQHNLVGTEVPTAPEKSSLQ